jgi:signal peptidase I
LSQNSSRGGCLSKSQGIKAELTPIKSDELSLKGTTMALLLQSILKKGFPARFRLRGSSMLPFLKDGDLITIVPLENKSLLKGDILAFINSKDGRLTVHRMIRKKDNYFIFKGDHNSKKDDLVSRDQLLGYVNNIQRKGKSIIFGLDYGKRLLALLSQLNVISHASRSLKKIRLIINHGKLQ